MKTTGNWNWARFGDVLEIRNGRNQREVEVPGGKYPIYGSGGEMGRATDYICEAQTTIIGRKGSISSPLFVEERFWNVDTAFGLHAFENLEPRFLYYYCKHYDFWQHNRGTTIPSLVKSELLEIRMPLPPRSEQQRIVSKLDAAFAALAEAQANVERNRANARELFESYLNGVFGGKGVGWEMKLLQEVTVEFGRGKSKHRPRGDVRLLGGKYPFIQTGDISNAEQYITSYSQTYNEIGLAQSKLWPRGTVCMAIVGVGSADTAILDFEACFPDSVIGIVVDDGEAHNEYVQYLLEYYKAELKAKGKGTARENMNLGMFEAHRFPFPSRKRQEEIVTRLNAIRKESVKLETTYQHKLTELAGLKKGVLGAAFRGEL